MFALLYVIFTKFFPIVSIWEIREGREKALEEAAERIQSYLPGRALDLELQNADGGMQKIRNPQSAIRNR
jgi:hypothetical protein